MNLVNWFEIYVSDIEYSKAFYQKVLNIELQYMDAPPEDSSKMLAFPKKKGSQEMIGSLVHLEGVQVGKNSTVIYFSSEDCAVEEARIEEAGGRIVKSKFAIGQYGFICLAYDPDGNLFGIHSTE